MRPQDKFESACSLIERALAGTFRQLGDIRSGTPYQLAGESRLDARQRLAMHMLSHLEELWKDVSPDGEWYREFYLLTGDHMQLTEEGWIPADQNTFEATGAAPMEVLDEVNAPVAASAE